MGVTGLEQVNTGGAAVGVEDGAHHQRITRERRLLEAVLGRELSPAEHGRLVALLAEPNHVPAAAVAPGGSLAGPERA